MISGIEKRGAKRVSYVCEIQCEGIGIGKLNTRINDISTTGLFIDSLAHMSVGSVMDLRFMVLDVEIEVEAEVRYCMPQVGMGIQFRNLKPEYHYVIECLVERKPVEKEIFASLIPLPLASQSTPPQPSLSPELPPPDQQPAGQLPQPGGFPPAVTTPSASSQPVAELSPVQKKSTAELLMMADEAIILMGNFTIISIFDVIQMIENSKVSGELVIMLPMGAGEIYFNAGRIANARAGQSYGAEAMNTFLELTEGSFRFRKTDQEYAQIIQATSNTGLLLDLLASKDEAAVNL